MADNKNKQISWLKFITLSAPSRFSQWHVAEGLPHTVAGPRRHWIRLPCFVLL